jgi:hypothetical protein
MNGFGGLGINPTMFAWYQVYAVDPGDYRHLIAPDVVNQKMMRSRDGGERWTEIPGMTSLVTDGGRLLFRTSMFPIVSALSFCPYDPRLVLAGTREGGVYVSTDNGARWSKIPDSEGVTYATAFHWLSADDAVASSYGRGLWRLRHKWHHPRGDFEQLCEEPCLPWDFGREEGDPPEWDQGILVFDGRVMGVAMKRGEVREIFVSPAATVVTFGDDKAFSIEITRTSKEVGFADVRRGPKKKGWFVKGLRLSGRVLRTAILTDREMARAQAPVEAEEIAMSTASPIAGKPYLTLRTKGADGVAVASPKEPLELRGASFPAGAALHVEIDGQPVSGPDKLEASAEGLFHASVPPPLREGLHTIVVKHGGRVVDGSMFIVKHDDEDADKGQREGKAKKKGKGDRDGRAEKRAPKRAKKKVPKQAKKKAPKRAR